SDDALETSECQSSIAPTDCEWKGSVDPDDDDDADATETDETMNEEEAHIPTLDESREGALRSATGAAECLEATEDRQSDLQQHLDLFMRDADDDQPLETRCSGVSLMTSNVMRDAYVPGGELVILDDAVLQPLTERTHWQEEDADLQAETWCC
ncbi:unnamed protein product, partial [Polarella glacialis]